MNDTYTWHEEKAKNIMTMEQDIFFYIYNIEEQNNYMPESLKLYAI